MLCHCWHCFNRSFLPPAGARGNVTAAAPRGASSLLHPAASPPSFQLPGATRMSALCGPARQQAPVAMIQLQRRRGMFLGSAAIPLSFWLLSAIQRGATRRSAPCRPAQAAGACGGCTAAAAPPGFVRAVPLPPPCWGWGSAVAATQYVGSKLIFCCSQQAGPTHTMKQQLLH